MSCFYVLFLLLSFPVPFTCQVGLPKEKSYPIMHVFAWLCLLVEVALRTTLHMLRGPSFDPLRRVTLLAGLPSLDVNRA